MIPACTVPRHELDEVRYLSETIQEAIVSILAHLADHSVAKDLAPYLTDIAFASVTIHDCAKRVLREPDPAIDDEPSVANETHTTGDANDERSAGGVVEADDPVALARSMQQRRHGGPS